MLKYSTRRAPFARSESPLVPRGLSGALGLDVEPLVVLRRTEQKQNKVDGPSDAEAAEGDQEAQSQENTAGVEPVDAQVAQKQA